jgi:hypothetical protein
VSGGLERIAEQERADTDRKHGEHILGAVADVRERRGTEEDPVLQLLRKAHEPQKEE